MASGESIWKVLVFVVIVTYVCYITEISNFYPDWNFATNLRPSFIDKIASVVRAEDSREEIEMTAASGELSNKERLELIYKELPEGREKSKRYFSLPLTTTWSGGGVGNQLFEVFALLGLSNSSHRTPLVFQKNGSVLGKMLARIRLHFPALIEQITLVSNPAILENTTDVALHRKGCCRYWPIDELLEKNTSAVVSGRGIYFQSHLYWIHIRPSLLKWMTPSEFAANETKYAFRERDLVEGQVLCVHARRGNFLHTRQAASEANFTQSATKYIIKKYLKKKPGPITVLLFSNDLSWMRETYSEIYRNKNDNESFVQVGNVLYILVDNLSAFNTLIVAKDYCDNFLITAAASTYAYMMSFLAKNGRAKVFYAEHFATPYNTLPRHFNPKEFHLPHWIPLRLLDNLDITQISRDEIQPWATTSRPTTKKANG
ncbi:unnamed protein product, partial [Mesorhabditis belari]|uniref:Uncharacterized protein n=1 Tax=Mesorhabditis belari TaxID=2138241 RepID=A0AAF3ERA8_9BILA